MSDPYGNVTWNAEQCERCKELCRGNPHKRYYCPRCGSVGCGQKRQDEWIVRPHYNRGAPCPGGPVHETKDKAP